MQNKIFTIIFGIIATLGFATVAFGAPSYRIERTILPETDSTYELGTSTRAWLRGFFDELCLNGDCETAWPSGGGSGSVATSSTEVRGQIPYWTSNGGTPATLGTVATGTLTAGDGITASAARYVIGGDVDFDCDTASGSVFGCLSAADWTTFNAKESVLSFVYPLVRAVNSVSLAFGTTTQNTWSGHNIFSSLFATNASSTNATSSNFSITNALSFGGVVGTTWASFCTSITGSADLCDGSDASGSGGGSSQWSRTGTEVHLATSSDTVRIGTTTSNGRLTISSLFATSSTELITNGTFTGNANGWTLGNCTAYFSNNASSTYNDPACDDPTISQAITLLSGELYQVSFTVSGNQGSMYAYFDGANLETGEIIVTGSPVTYTYTSVGEGQDTIFFDSWNYANGDHFIIDNVSVKHVDVPPVLVGYGYNGARMFELGGYANMSTWFGDMLFASTSLGGDIDRRIYVAPATATRTPALDDISGTPLSIFGGDAYNDGVSIIDGGRLNLWGGSGANQPVTSRERVCVNGSCISSNRSGNYTIGGTGLSSDDGIIPFFNRSTSFLYSPEDASILKANNNNTMLGVGAGFSMESTGFSTQNTALGLGTLNAATSSSQSNTAIGYQALGQLSEGNSNIAIGIQSMYGHVYGNAANNIGIGTETGFDLTNGNDNVMIGFAAGQNIQDGFYNTIIGGAGAGSGIVSGTNNIVIGNTVDFATDGDNRINIGGLVYGKNLTNLVGSGLSAGQISIGTTTATAINVSHPAKLTVDQGTTASEEIANFIANTNDFAEINTRNLSSGALAQGCNTVTRNDGTITTGFIALCANSSGFWNPQTYNAGGANDTNIMSLANDFLVVQGTSGKSMRFLNGGSATTTSEVLTLKGTNAGFGTTSPWAKLSVVDNTAGMPKFAVATSSGGIPLFMVDATSTSPMRTAARVAIGTSTSQTGVGGQWPLVVDGEVYSTRRHIRCETMDSMANLTADSVTGICGDGFGFDEVSQAATIQTATPDPVTGIEYLNMWAGLTAVSSATVASGAGGLVGLTTGGVTANGWTTSSSSPSFEALVSLQPTNGTSTVTSVGLFQLGSGGTVAPTDAQVTGRTGYGFVATSTATNGGKWFAVAREGANSYVQVNTDVVASTTGSIVWQKLRVNVKVTGAQTRTATYFINDVRVAQINMTVVGAAAHMSPVVAIGAQAAGLAKNIYVSYIRAWADLIPGI